MVRMTVYLRAEEREALQKMSEQQRRDPRHQAAIAIRGALEAEGYLAPQTPDWTQGEGAILHGQRGDVGPAGSRGTARGAG